MRAAIICLLCVILPAASFAQLSGPITGVIEAGNYTVIGDIWVPEGQFANLNAGVTFDFTGAYTFEIHGTLIGEGVEGNPVLLTSSENEWFGITFPELVAGASTLHYTIIENSTDTGVTIINARPDFNNCTIQNNAGTGVSVNGSTAIADFDGCTISNNSGRGMMVSNDAAVTMDDCIVQGNTSLFGAGVAVFNSSLDVSNTTIQNNSTSGFSQDGGGGLYATGSDVSIADSYVIGNSTYDDNNGGSGAGVHISGGSFTLTGTTFSNNYLEVWDLNGYGGGLYLTNLDSVEITDCAFYSNETMGWQLSGEGAAIAFTNLGTLHINNCFFLNNSAVGEFAAGGAIWGRMSAELFIERSVFAGNYTDVEGGAIATDQVTDVHLLHCTVYDNTAWVGGGVWADAANGTSSLLLNNSIFAQNSNDAIHVGTNTTASVNYNCFYANTADITGNSPDQFAMIVNENQNGDPCDTYYNIFLDPLFTNPANDDFTLTAESPCIDAGNPFFPADPDNTIADIGAFYYEGNTLPASFSLVGLNTEVPSGGGAVSYQVLLSTDIDQSFNNVNYWLKITLPNGNTLQQPITLVTLNVPPYAEFDVQPVIFQVPAWAPAGTYACTGRVGFYPDYPILSDSFQFVKNGVMGDGSSIEGGDFTTIHDEPVFVVESSTVSESPDGLPELFSVSAPWPNPFNPSVSVTVSLPEAGTALVTVVDITGRQVARMHNGKLSAGDHRFTLDGSNLASGVYVFDVHAGDERVIRKAMLIR